MSRVIDVPLNQAAGVIASDEKKRIGAVFQAIRDAAHVGAKIISERAPQDIGKLAASSHVEGEWMRQTVQTIVDAPYAACVELGTRPHYPPIAPLIDWVHRHIGSYSDVSTGNSGDADRVAYAIAKGIQKKIGERGTEPTFFVRGSLPDLASTLHSFVSLRLAGW
jgi:hypothetical protein